MRSLERSFELSLKATNKAPRTIQSYLESLSRLIEFNEYVIGIMAYVWLPNVFDTLVLFAPLTVELFLAHFAPQGAAGLGGYLLEAEIAYVVGVAAFVQEWQRASALAAVADNRTVHQRLEGHL